MKQFTYFLEIIVTIILYCRKSHLLFLSNVFRLWWCLFRQAYSHAIILNRSNPTHSFANINIQQLPAKTGDQKENNKGSQKNKKEKGKRKKKKTTSRWPTIKIKISKSWGLIIALFLHMEIYNLYNFSMERRHIYYLFIGSSIVDGMVK